MVLPFEFQAKTIIEEGRTNHTALQEIKNWLKTTTLPDLQGEMIVLFLLSCENDVSETRNTIEAYFKIKNRAPEIFSNRDIDEESLTKAIRTTNCFSIPKRLENTLIVFFKLSDTNYRNFVPADSAKIAFMMPEVSQKSDPPDDIIFVVDLEGMTFMHLTCIKITFVKNCVDYMQHGMPLKIKTMHILNTNYVIQKLLALVKLFMTHEFAKTLEVHSPTLTMKEFQEKFIPASHLPKEYDGDLPSCEELTELSISQLRETKKFFEAGQKLISDYDSKK